MICFEFESCVLEVTEALLEMHFHQAIVKCFEETFGAKFLRLLKPSPQNEVWVGFDQGWSRTSLSNSDLYQQLKTAIQNGGGSISGFYVGYFMQFKAVRPMERLSKYAPDMFVAPYYRAELSLDTNETTGLSQHQTLSELCKVAGADVSYVCPMMWDISEVYTPADVEQLRVVDVHSAPDPLSPGRHFIAFQTRVGGDPVWCSEPVPAKALTFREWAESLALGDGKLTAEGALSLIERSEGQLRLTLHDRGRATLPPAFTLMEFSPMASDR